jgi:hypothetical protein
MIDTAKRDLIPQVVVVLGSSDRTLVIRALGTSVGSGDSAQEVWVAEAFLSRMLMRYLEGRSVAEIHSKISSAIMMTTFLVKDFSENRKRKVVNAKWEVSA